MTLGVSNHAVERYVERVKPHLGEKQAREELEALSRLGERTGKPYWFLGYTRADFYLQIGPEAVAAVKDACLTTVVTPEITRQNHRDSVNDWKRRKRARKALKRKEFPRKYNRRPEEKEAA
jgi:hypothetical protein